MEEVSPTRLLVALSKGFALEKQFAEKIGKILSSFFPEEVAITQDERRIGERYFSGRGLTVQAVTLGNSRSAIKRSIDHYSHIVVFWDGDDLTELVYFSKLLQKNLRVIPVQLAKVRNKDKEERYDVYIGRGTPWGNPFPIGIGGTGDSRETVIEKYQVYFNNEILNDPEKKKSLLSLRGYRLGCHCKPLACHGDIIAEFLNSYDGD